MKLLAPWSQATCPFCFHQFHLSEVSWRMTGDTAPRAEDRRVGNFLSMPPPKLGSVLTAEQRGTWSRLVSRFLVSGPSEGRLRKICPECHMYLPNATAAGELSSEVIAIIGDRSSGKSNFFGVLLHTLEARYAREVGFTIYDQETFSASQLKPISSRKLYKDRYASSLFDPDNPKAVGQNLSAAQDRSLRVPLIYRINFPRRWSDWVRHPFGSVRPMDLVIFDTAGEDLRDAENLEKFCQFILRATGIIFIIDPFEFAELRAKIPPKVRDGLPKPVDADPLAIVSLVANQFETYGRIRAGQKITVPTAFAFSKSDLLKYVVHPTSPILRDSRHAGGFAARDALRVSEEVESCALSHDSRPIVELANERFKTRQFFAFSALGQLPSAQLRIKRPAPLRVADPLLWLLWQRGFIPAVD